MLVGREMKSNALLYRRWGCVQAERPIGGVEVRGLLEKYPTFGREKETGLLGALDT